jgi:hypothetical protein
VANCNQLQLNIATQWLERKKEKSGGRKKYFKEITVILLAIYFLFALASNGRT